jgi:hypothetical protein
MVSELRTNSGDTSQRAVVWLPVAKATTPITMFKNFFIKLLIVLIIAGAIVFYFTKTYQENRLLLKIIERLSADSRIAEVLVSGVKFDPLANKAYTTIKFLEYDTKLNPLTAKYFTFSGNIIQFQSMVIRFDDFYIKKAHPLKGKSAYLFMKVFSLGDNGVEVFEINKINEVPAGYEVEGAKNSFEKGLWQKFWQYALDPQKAKKIGIKNAQIEAPGTKFIPGLLYTIKIEHDGGMRIDVQSLSQILRGEKIE